MSTQTFTRNYSDHSNDTGFQFEFFCDKCGNGHRSEFQTNSLGFAAQMMKAAGSIFGGGLANAGYGADRINDALRGSAWDSAFKKAVEECRPKFRQCTLCGTWVCPEVCFNQERGLCEGCAPDLKENLVAAQAKMAVEQATEKARAVDQTGGQDFSKAGLGVSSQCQKCNSSLADGAKFCPNCGLAVVAKTGPKFCSGCGAGLQPGAHFCSGCGAGV